MTEVTLKPCAFCGGAPLIGQTLDHAWYAMCEKDFCARLESYWRTEAEAVAAWNTRPASTEPADAPKQRPWCETCGKGVHEVLCPTCAKWWNDNPPPNDALAEAREALALARNRLQACAVEATVRAMAQSYEWAEWAADADAALSRLNAQGEKP